MRPTQGIVLLGCALVAACGSEPAVPATGEVQAPAKLTTGDVTVRATALPSMRLGDAMASRYGVARDPDTVLLVIGMRRGPQSAETSVAGRVGAEANNLLGNRQRIALRELHRLRRHRARFDARHAAVHDSGAAAWRARGDAALPSRLFSVARM